jgi:hypothetical protein
MRQLSAGRAPEPGRTPRLGRRPDHRAQRPPGHWRREIRTIQITTPRPSRASRAERRCSSSSATRPARTANRPRQPQVQDRAGQDRLAVLGVTGLSAREATPSTWPPTSLLKGTEASPMTIPATNTARNPDPVQVGAGEEDLSEGNCAPAGLRGGASSTSPPLRRRRTRSHPPRAAPSRPRRHPLASPRPDGNRPLLRDELAAAAAREQADELAGQLQQLELAAQARPPPSWRLRPRQPYPQDRYSPCPAAAAVVGGRTRRL